MIVCGYPCIGKSTVAKQDPMFIDLESSYFKIEGRDNTGWHENYCMLAIELHRTGHVVFTSTHADVVEFLTDGEKMFRYDLKPTDVKICYPDPYLYSDWIDRATVRWQSSGLVKDRLALKRIIDYWDVDIAALAAHTDHAVPIMNPSLYDLREMFKP